ncbi:LOW QUALITY PROTEIN: nephrocystin-3-like [Dioscorea cayenensis subsp. rotundata]|uniref:LOW QUALITY PROTEIN: nephrocystin-3-like n=1 Tax=Dioscorea cayennensis subsp. rotundata TaxID=55577 RepID=A0AB40C0B5_DIOCR|nr:LOW QUALITY PROTEIN: nephrocystin-3-like [Dioscorea cayenensis subsp. rotundata]
MRRSTFSLLSSISKLTISPRFLHSPSSSLLLPLLHHHHHHYHHSFQPCESRSIQAFSQTSSVHHHIFDSATSTKQLLEAFNAMETTSDENDKRLGLACLEVGERLHSDSSETPEKALTFAVRAFRILEKDGGDSLSLAKALLLLGKIGYRMKRFDDSLKSLNTAEQVLDGMPSRGCGDSGDARVRVAVQAQIADTKILMGRRYEALVNLRRVFELKSLIFAAGSREMGDSYKDLAEFYTSVLEFQEALPLALKALDIYEERLGSDSMEVIQVRRLLGVVYTSLGENEEALKQNEMARSVLEDLHLNEELFYVEIEKANMQISLGRLDNAIDTLKGVIAQAEKESDIRAVVFVSMAKALFNQDKFGDSKRCLEIACGILDKKKLVSPDKVAETYAETSLLYEAMNDFEIAMSLMKRTLAIIEKLPQQLHLAGSISARLGWLLLLTRRVSDAVPLLEAAVEQLKGSFGPMHFGLGFVYKHLGQTYLEMNQPQEALRMLLLGKKIIEKTFGEDHEDSIDTCQCIANSYGAMESYALALEFQKHVIDSWERHGPNASDELREAHRLLEQLKKKAQGSPSAVFPANTLPLSRHN